jgi:FMN phosphatase YigB (HAD superfamily)
VIRAVFFDVGETLVDETRMWLGWAEHLDVSPLTFFAVLGAVIVRGEPHRRVFDHLAPGLDLAAAAAERKLAGRGYEIEPRDLYPDALPALAELKGQGLTVGVAGNQPEAAEAALARCGLIADHVASSARWGVEKPSPEFFARIGETCGLAPAEIAYVGDRVDNDVVPAADAGMFSVFLVRGPWGVLHANRPDAARADLTLNGLAGLAAALARLA